jgi:hypothetical protein
VDLTNGLKNRTLGELDRSVIDFQSNKFYEKILDVYNAGKSFKQSTLLHLFNIQLLELNNKKFFVPSAYVQPINKLYNILTVTYQTDKEKLSILENNTTASSLKTSYKRFSYSQLNEILGYLKKLLTYSSK